MWWEVDTQLPRQKNAPKNKIMDITQVPYQFHQSIQGAANAPRPGLDSTPSPVHNVVPATMSQDPHLVTRLISHGYSRVSQGNHQSIEQRRAHSKRDDAMKLHGFQNHDALQIPRFSAIALGACALSLAIRHELGRAHPLIPELTAAIRESKELAHTFVSLQVDRVRRCGISMDRFTFWCLKPSLVFSAV